MQPPAAFAWGLHRSLALLVMASPPVFSSCVPVSGSRMYQSVTVEEDNCCGCNVLAIRRHFLDQDLKQVHIVYTSCHDAVSRGGVKGQPLGSQVPRVSMSARFPSCSLILLRKVKFLMSFASRTEASSVAKNHINKQTNKRSSLYVCPLSPLPGQVYETPFFVAVDHEKKKVVISIRGTLSPKVGDRHPLPPALFTQTHGPSLALPHCSRTRAVSMQTWASLHPP